VTADPVLIAYAALRGQGRRRPYWQRIGHAYPHDEGAGLTVVLDALPMDGRVVLLERDHADDKRLAAEARRFQPIGKRRGGA
jgi:hypothetical protein